MITLIILLILLILDCVFMGGLITIAVIAKQEEKKCKEEVKNPRQELFEDLRRQTGG